MEEKITNIIKKLNLVENKNPKLPYKVSISKLPDNIGLEIESYNKKLDEFNDKIIGLENKINNPTIYTNDLGQEQITKENMVKLKNYYDLLIEELKSFTTINPSKRKTNSKNVANDSQGDNILNFYEISNTLDTYTKYYLAYLLSNILSLNIFLKIYIIMKKYVYITDNYINEAIKKVFEGNIYDINFDKIDDSPDTIYNILRFEKTDISENNILLVNNGFEINLNINLEKDSNEPYNHSNCEAEGILKVPIFTESFDKNFKKISLTFRYDNKIINNNFAFEINYYGCTAVFGVATTARRQFILSNKSNNKLKFYNFYDDFNYLND